MFSKRGFAIATAGVASLALALGAAPPALADGPDTPPHVLAAIQEDPWVELTEGDSDYRVVAVGYFLQEFGVYLGEEPKLEFTPNVTFAVHQYQLNNELVPTTGNLDSDTWDQLSDDVGLVRRGDDSMLVAGLRHTLTYLGHDSTDTTTNRFGPEMEQAVRDFQKRKGIDDDGIIGPVTFRAMYAESAEDEE
ncbi:peptidoglycan-binding domain-containing protein [Halostreptopolyspora alba]|uniref:peptidoglycan-binding domain-containing protein n=1 Tax=Halostreptopolyspora alba TaxID=2487137 RepID=UPI0026DA3509